MCSSVYSKKLQKTKVKEETFIKMAISGKNKRSESGIVIPP